MTLDPLSPGRFRVTFTADAELKRKIELARDLLRHAVPQGDLAIIFGRALDVLIERTQQRRFAKASRPSTRVPTQSAGESALNRAPSGVEPVRDGRPPGGCAQDETPTRASAPRRSRHLPNEVRRAVLERDGERCTWQAPDGNRCNSRAWLELDHIIPRGQGGTDDPANIRLYCRAHNRVAAEQAYGRSTIERIIAQRGTARQQSPHPP